MRNGGDSTHRDSRRRWRPWRFSLSTALLAITVFGVWLGVVVNRAERQKKAIDAFRASAEMFRFRYDYEFDAAGNVIEVAAAPGPEWLRHRIGTDYLADVHSVSISGTFTDDAAMHFNGAPHLRILQFSEVSLGDAEFQRVAELRELRRLYLLGTKTIDNDALAHLGKIARLETLLVDAAHVDDEGLEPLSRLDRLQELWLHESLVTGPGLRHLSELQSLRSLSLNYSPITDEGLAHLAELPNLESLSLRRTAITDAGIVHLERMTQLKDLDLDSTKLSNEAVEQLQKALPATQINGPWFSN